MERGHEFFPGLDPERETGRERSIEREPNHEDLLEAFESGKRFDDEDAKARDYNARLDRANTYQQEVDELSERIASTTSQLAVLPLTYDQQILLDAIEKLISLRQRSKSGAEQAQFDVLIEQKTKELATLPTTDEQGSLLDSILELIDAREAASVKLRAVFSSAS